jgi:hypothetical protein
MEQSMLSKTLKMTALAVSIGAGALVALSGPASAYTVCNRAGDCWHTDTRDHYAPALGVHFYSDDWYSHHQHDAHYRWHEHHDGRGYWRNGIWINL